MSINTVDKPEDKREKLRLLREFHKPVFEALGIPDALFIPKLAYKPAGMTEKAVAYFASEMAKGQDIYTEFADSEYDPQDSERRLYKWRFNHNYKEEYQLVESSGTFRYLVPVAELVLVKTNSPDILVEQAATKGNIQLKLEEVSATPQREDLSLKDASLRDIAAILWKKPVSNKKWVNDLIVKAYE